MLQDEFPMIAEREEGMTDNVPKVGVGFGYLPLQNEAKSQAAGHAVFEEVVHVRIQIPGDRNSIVLQPASEEHKRRFPKAWEFFLKRGERPTEGMPIQEWAVLTRSQSLTLRAMGIHTVEMLAEVHDGNLSRAGINRELRDKAKAYFKQAEDNKELMRQQSELAKRDSQIQALQDQLTQLTAMMTSDKAKKTKAA